MSETVYVNKCSIKEHTFENGDTILNMAIHEDEFEEHSNKDGWLNIVICKRRETAEDGKSHYAKVNTYEPESKVSSNEESEDVRVPF